MKLFHLPYSFFVFVMSVSTVYFACKYIKQYSSLLFLSLLIFISVGQFYFNTFNAIRQSIVIFLFLANLNLIKQQNFMKYLLLIMFCFFCFHKTALILLPMYFILNRKYNLKTKLILLVAVLLNSKIFLVLIQNSPYAVYLKMEDFASGVSLNTYFIGIISIACLILEHVDTRTTGIDPILFNLNYLSLLLVLLCIQFSGTPLIMVFNRISYYFSPIMIVLIPMLINLSKVNKKILLCCFSIIFLFLGLFSICLNGVTNHIVPYKTILF